MKISRVITVLGTFAVFCLQATAADVRKPVVSNPWVLQGTLTATEEPLYLDWTVAISGNTIVTSGGGVVYVYVRSGGRWIDMIETAKLTASDGSYFSRVAISGNTIVAGANSANGDVGAAYVFVEPAGGWTDMTETAQLKASDGMPGDGLGSVTISGNTVVAGADQNNGVGINYPVGPGAAYVFVKPAAGWSNMTETAKLTSSDGVSGDDFGFNVAVLGNTIAAVAPDATVNGNHIQGAVYVFQKNGSVWTTGTETAKLTTSDGQTFDALGVALGISGNTIAASSNHRVYVFNETTGGWVTGTQTAELQDSIAYIVLLDSLAIGNPYLLSGSVESSGHPVVDLYIEPSTGWANAAPTNRFRPPAGQWNDENFFGWAVAIQGTTLVISAPGDGGTSRIYVYGRG